MNKMLKRKKKHRTEGKMRQECNKVRQDWFTGVDYVGATDKLEQCAYGELANQVDKFEKTLLLDDTLTGCEFSQFTISLNSRTFFDKGQKLDFFYIKDSNDCFLCIRDKIPTEGTFSSGVCVVPAYVLDCLAEPRVFSLSWFSHESGDSLCVKVLINEKAIFTNLQYAAQPFSNRFKCDIKRVIEYFYSISFKEPEVETYDLRTPIDIPSKYIGNCFNPEKEVIIMHESLIPNLRPYQCQAVKFMIDCERETKTADGVHLLFTEIKLDNGSTIYFHNYCGFFVREKFKPLPKCRGGILADEMGTGKTLDVIACILLNPRKNSSQHDFRSRDDSSFENVVINAEIYNKYLNQELSANSAHKRKSYFECICKNADSESETIQCKECGLIQHLKCVSSYQCAPEHFKCQHCLNEYNQATSSCSEISNSSEALKNQGKRFECICGLNGSKRKKSVTCINCGLIQHPECVLANSSVKNTEYVCPYCLVNCPEYVVKSPTTLIVAPHNIIDQWEDEIRLHVAPNSLKILKYHGISHHKFMYPAFIAQHDVVLIAYETLKAELNYAKVCYGDDQYKLRHAKKFRSLPTPLLAIEWWRVCLDEAQMFENVTTKASQIVLQLQSVNKWCISGTPVQQSYRDFFGYFMFLGYDPYCVKHWFNVILWDPFQKGKRENFFSALRKILWRTLKEDVLSQINIPQQETVIHELEFSPVEKVYYEHIKTKHRKNVDEILSKYEALGQEGKLIDKLEATKILKPLTKLHMSCNFITGVSNRIVTKEELYDKMLQIRKGECSELHRKLIFSLNGAAGLLRLSERPQNCYEIYRTVFRLMEENKKNIHTDLLQHIHALHNYCSLMESETSPPEDLVECQNKLNELSTCYLRKFTEGMTIALKNLKEQTAKIENSFNLFTLGDHTEHISWWIEILNSVDEESQDKFIGRLKISLKNAGGKICMPHFTSISNKFREISGLKHCLLKAFKDLHEARCSLLKSMSDFHDISAEDIRFAVYCHLRGTSRCSICLLCNSDRLLKHYESKLFCFTEVPDSSDEDFSEDEDSRNNRLRKGTFETLRKGTHADSELEISLKFFFSYSRYIPALSKYTEEGVKELKLFEALKKEFKALRNMWMKTSDFIAALDELDMAKMSIRLRAPDEEPRNPPVPYIIEPDEVDEIYEDHSYEINVIHEEFNRTLGSLNYLKNLKEINCGNEKPTCPVCREEFVGAWYALQCGHCLCFDCCNRMITLKGSIFGCPECRSPTKIEDMYHTFYSDRKGDDIDLKGHFSTKVTAVMQCLLKIHREDHTAKILVFSKWSKVLSILQTGLHENGIPLINITEKKSFYENIKAFKNSANMNVLLLPYEFGSKGLNLIEATYVILVEPCIIKAHMLQAVGRVHRIGQTKKTFVHLFFVKDTIDEKIYILQERDTGETSKVSFHSKDILYLYE